MPQFLAIGVSYDFFMASYPKKLDPFLEAYKLQQEIKDNDMWQLGLYMQRAVSVSIDHCLNGSKAKSEYFKEPILKKAFENRNKTQEELDNEELRRMLLAEELWQMQAREKGLPEVQLH